MVLVKQLLTEALLSVTDEMIRELIQEQLQATRLGSVSLGCKSCFFRVSRTAARTAVVITDPEIRKRGTISLRVALQNFTKRRFSGLRL